MAINPVIGIVGGIRQETLKGITKEEFDKSIDNYRKACQSLGGSLAKAQMRLLVWSSDPRFIERDVVEGYLQSQNPVQGSIICVWNKDHFPAFPQQDAENGPILLKQSHHDDWEIGFYESIKKEADGIIVLGGGATTLIAGVVAASWGKAVFTTPHFHGKAEMLYRWMHTDSKMVASAPISADDIDLMSRPWNPDACIKSLQDQLAAIKGLKVQQRIRQTHYSSIENQLSKFRSTQRQSVVVVLAIFAFIVSMVAAIAIPTGIINFVFFFLVLLFGGALGSTLSLLGTQRESAFPIERAAVIGAGVGVIVGVVQISPNISQVITIDGTLKVDIPLIFSSAVFALLGGLAFESTLQNLMLRAKGAGTSSSKEEKDENPHS